jgi:cbb3-type cytochrome oxidase subunit 3
MHMNEFFGTLSGIITAVLILWFAGLVVWAWSKSRVASFSATARLPLEEDVPSHAATREDNEHTRHGLEARS